MDNFKIVLEALIDQSSFTNIQKQAAKQKIKVGAEIDNGELFKKLQATMKEIDRLEAKKVKLRPEVDTEQLKVLSSRLEDVERTYQNLLSTLFKSKDVTMGDIAKLTKDSMKIFESSNLAAAKKTDTTSLKESQQVYNDILKTAQQLNALQGKQLKLDPNTNSEEWNTLSKQIDEVSSKYDKLWSEFWGKPQNFDIFKMEDLNKLKELGYTLEQTKSKIQDLQKSSVKKIDLMANGGAKNDYATQISKLQGNFRSLGIAEDEVVSKTQKASTALQTLKTELAKPVEQQNFDAIKAANDAVQRELAETANEYTKLKASAQGYATEQQRLTLANTIEAWNQKNTAATKSVLEQNNKYIASLRELDVTMDRVSFDNIKNGFKQAENSMRGLGKLGASFRNQMKQAAQSFATWLSASTIVMTVISKTREAITELKEIDTLLTEISKANDSLSKSDLTGIGDRSFETASQYGRKATDYLAGVQEMSRAGYQNAEAMGELSVKAQGAGAMTADVANSFIVATDKAYKLNGSLTELTTVMDGINYITNHNAVNMTELSEGFSIVASTAASFGVESNELTAALGTMAASTQQSGSEVARAFRAILLNIRQVSDEEEGIDAEGLTKYEEACNALGVKLKETKNGIQELKDPMDVLRQLSVEYNKLSDTDIRKVNLLNSVGGKLRATQLDALLRGWSDYETMLGQFADGSGSMAREAEKTANSWEGSMNRLSNTWTDTIGNIANSSAITGLVNGLNSVLTLVNKLTSALGSLGSIGLGAGLFASFKNVGINMLVAYLSNRYCFELPTI